MQEFKIAVIGHIGRIRTGDIVMIAIMLLNLGQLKDQK